MGCSICTGDNTQWGVDTVSFKKSRRTDDFVCGADTIGLADEQNVRETQRIKITKRREHTGNEFALSWPEGVEENKCHERNNSEPIPGVRISYSAKPYTKEQTILVDETLVDTLAAPHANNTKRAPLKSFSRKSMSAVQKKKGQFTSDSLKVHQITHPDENSQMARQEIYKLIILLKEAWSKLDLDKDNHLNIPELKRFCEEVWEESVDDSDAKKILDAFAKEDPQKGMNFNEWCLLIKDEDPDLQEFVEEIYEIFVIGSISGSHSETGAGTGDATVKPS